MLQVMTALKNKPSQDKPAQGKTSQAGRGKTGRTGNTDTGTIKSGTGQRNTSSARDGDQPAGNRAARRNGPVTSTRNASFTAPGLSAQDGETVVEILQGRLASLTDLGLTL